MTRFANNNSRTFLKSTCKLFACLAFILIANTAFAQKLFVDSLQRALRDASQDKKLIIMAELARAASGNNADEAIKQGKDALALAKKSGDYGAIAFCYANVGHLLAQRDQERRAAGYIDSGIKAAAKSKDPVLAAAAWLRKGWLALVQGNNEKAMTGFLNAEKLLVSKDDKRALGYQTIINHYIASIYAYGNDTLKHRKYAEASLDAARKSSNPDDLLLGYMSVGHSYFSAFEKDSLNRNKLEQSQKYFRLALNLYSIQRQKILLQSNAAATSLNMANSYFKYYPVTFKDSVYKYVDTALSIARRTRGKEIMANCYGILSEYALRQRDFAGAERYLQIGIGELAGLSPGGVDITRSRLMLGLAKVAEASGATSKALSYYKQYLTYYNKVFDAQKLANTQQLEEEYHAAQRENEIIRLRERADYNHRLNWLYVAIGSSGIILLALLLSSYHYKLKASIKQAQLNEQEKEEAELRAKLQAAEAGRLALEKHEAELKASLQEEESAKLQAQQELLQDRTEWLEKELLAGTLKIEEKNGILQLLKEKTRDAAGVAKQIGRIINQSLRMDKNMDEQQSLSQIHPGFFNALQERANQGLTRLDLKYCAYILMGLDNKEIANRLGVEPKSIRMARYRIKQKLKLEKDANLDQALRLFEKSQTT